MQTLDKYFMSSETIDIDKGSKYTSDIHTSSRVGLNGDF